MLAPGRILLADDEETVLEATADLLRKEGYQCTCARDGHEALERLQTESYDLLIADIRMPGNSRLELLDALEQSGGPPMILMTGHPSVDTAARAVGGTVTAYLTKPVEFDELTGIVERSIARGRAHEVVIESRHRAADFLKSIDALERQLRDEHATSDGHSARAFAELTLANILAGVEDLQKLVGGEQIDMDETGALRELESSRLRALRDALQDAVDVLDQSKRAFKSKALGALRERIEDVLRGS